MITRLANRCLFAWQAWRLRRRRADIAAERHRLIARQRAHKPVRPLLRVMHKATHDRLRAELDGHSFINGRPQP